MSSDGVGSRARGGARGRTRLYVAVLALLVVGAATATIMMRAVWTTDRGVAAPAITIITAVGATHKQQPQTTGALSASVTPGVVTAVKPTVAAAAGIVLPSMQRRDRNSDKPIVLVLMSYAGSKRHHRLAEILVRMLVDERESYHASAGIRRAILVWNAPLTQLPSIVTDALKKIADADDIAAGDAGVARPSVDDNKEVSSHSGPVARVQRFGARVTVLEMKQNRVDNRWRIGAYLEASEVALSVDDDMMVHSEGAACLVEVQQATAVTPFVLVGVDVRAHCVHAQRSCKDHIYAANGEIAEGPPAGHGPLGYAARHIVDARKHFSIVLPRAILVTRETMLEFDQRWSAEDGTLRRIVDELKCDDIALNFVAANAHNVALQSGAAAGSKAFASSVYVKAKYRAFDESQDKTAMFKMPGMKAMRQKCVNRLAAYFNGTAPAHRRWFVSCAVDG